MNLFKLNRIQLTGIVLAVFAALVVVQMVQIQNNVKAQDLAVNIGERHNYEKKMIYPERGNIYDRWGHLMAGNKQVYDVGIALNQVQDPETISMVLASILGADQAQVFGWASTPYVQGKTEYITVKSNVSAEDVAKLSELKARYQEAPARKDGTKASLAGVLWVGHLQRTYPENTLAANILGYYPYLQGVDALGQSGIEEKYNDLLTGSPTEVIIPVDPKEVVEIPSVPPGASLVLTIDREIQTMVERVLDESVETNGADSGTAIVMDPKTGEILAMATTPRLNPNEYWEASEIFKGNTPFDRSISQTYEPGSVFKVLTMAAALDAGAVTPETTFMDTGSIEVGGIYINNWDRGAWGEQNMTGCMQHSLNVCLAWIATELGPTRFYDYLKAFGVGHRTNIDLADEQIWPLSLPGDENWYQVNLGTNSFGQGVAVTPIQMITAIASVANDGNMMAPHLVRQVIQDGEARDVRPMIIGSPIKAETAHTLTSMLADSLEEESSDALVEGYRVAGKTGTAEIPTPQGYSQAATNASFVGWGPVDDPKFIVYVWLEKPASSQWGSVVAAPLFRDIVKELVVLMNIPPDNIRQQIR